MKNKHVVNMYGCYFLLVLKICWFGNKCTINALTSILPLKENMLTNNVRELSFKYINMHVDSDLPNALRPAVDAHNEKKKNCDVKLYCCIAA